MRFELDGKPFIAIDTPGLRRTKSIQTDVDFYGLHRAQRSIRRADVVLLFFDAMQPISKVDKQLADYIVEQHKPCVFVVNKWDLVAGRSADRRLGRSTCATRFAPCTYVPIAFITAQTGKNVKTLCNHAQMLFKQARHRVSTSQINDAVAGRPGRQPAADAPSRPAEDLLCDAGRCRAADDCAILQQPAGVFGELSPLFADRPCATGCRSPKCRSGYICGAASESSRRKARNQRRNRQAARATGNQGQ